VATTDVDGLVALYDGLSDDDRYRRFFSGFRPPRSFFERLVNVGERGGFGLVATMGAGGDVAGGARIVGEASYELLPNGDGELAITVAADQRGWLGPYLLDALVEVAAARGVRNLEADVLVTNGRMLALLRSRGYATMGSNDWTTLRLVVGTAGRTPVWPAGHGATGHSDRPRVLVEVPGGRWHAGAEADEAGLRVIACSGPRGARPRCPVLAGRPCPLAANAAPSSCPTLPTTIDGALCSGRTPTSIRACPCASSAGCVVAPGTSRGRRRPTGARRSRWMKTRIRA
jgi:hypothetical protein